MSELTVRAANKEDVDRIFFLLVEMAKENSKHKISVGKALEHISGVVTCGGCAVVENGNEIVGSVGVSIQSNWFSNDKFLGDSWFYVSPEYRNSRAAILLKRFIFGLADTARMNLVLAVVSTTDGERKSKFFARDMECLGGTFVKECQDGLHLQERAASPTTDCN